MCFGRPRPGKTAVVLAFQNKTTPYEPHFCEDVAKKPYMRWWASQWRRNVALKASAPLALFSLSDDEKLCSLPSLPLEICCHIASFLSCRPWAGDKFIFSCRDFQQQRDFHSTLYHYISMEYEKKHMIEENNNSN